MLIRLYQNQAILHLLTLRRLLSEGWTTEKMVNACAAGDWDPTATQERKDTFAAIVATTRLPDMEEAYDILTAQVKRSTDPEHDADLVDTMARILGMPYPGNRLGGATLLALKHAILIPSEYNQVRQSAEKSWSCARCNRIISIGEACTLHTTGEAGAAIYCVQCRDISYFPCGTCGTIYARNAVLGSCSACKLRKKEGANAT